MSQLSFNFTAAPTTKKYFNANGEEILSPEARKQLAKIHRAIYRLEIQIDRANAQYDYTTARRMQYSIEAYRRQEKALYA